MQEARIAFENRIRAIKDEVTPEGRIGFIMEKGLLEGAPPNTLKTVKHRGKETKILGLKHYENQLIKQMKPIVESDRLWVEWLSRIKGIGILTAAQLIAYFEPYWAQMEIPLYKKKQHKGKKLKQTETKTQKLYPPKHRSSLTHLCDYLVNEKTGRAERRERGKPTSGNPRYKTLFYKIFESLIRQKGECYNLWKQYHNETIESYPKWLNKWYNATTRKEVKKQHPKKYIPNTLDLSRRRFIKTFISLLWEKMQEIYNLPITRPQHAPNKPLTDKEWIHPNDVCELIPKC